MVNPEPTPADYRKFSMARVTPLDGQGGRGPCKGKSS
jgi:hypothetical protein